MNAANYSWTESINRASNKPGEIHRRVLQVVDALAIHSRFIAAH